MIKKNNSAALFHKKQIRRHWDGDKEVWYFSIVDVIEVLTENKKPRKYWNDLKKKLLLEGSQLSEKIGQLKMKSSDGKFYKTDVFNTKNIFRLIQSIPSKKAEPFKLWLAKVGKERLDEIADPELAFDRAIKTYLQKGYSKNWINQRLKTIEVRKDLTDDLRDNMTNLELILNMLAEATTAEISKEKKPKTFSESKIIARKGGDTAGKARKDIEQKTGKSVLSSQNAQYLQNKDKKN